MTKTLLTKIVIGVLATGTVGTVGLVVASKIPATAETIKSIPVVGQYIDVVTFNKGLSDEEFAELKYLKQHDFTSDEEYKLLQNAYIEYNNELQSKFDAEISKMRDEFYPRIKSSTINSDKPFPTEAEQEAFEKKIRLLQEEQEQQRISDTKLKELDEARQKYADEYRNRITELTLRANAEQIKELKRLEINTTKKDEEINQEEQRNYDEIREEILKQYEQ